VYKLLLDFLEL